MGSKAGPHLPGSSRRQWFVKGSYPVQKRVTSPLTVAGAAPEWPYIFKGVTGFPDSTSWWENYSMWSAFARRQIDADDAPIHATAGAMETVDAGDREIINGEGKRLIRLDAKRLAKRRADCAAMRDGDDV